MLVLGAGLIGLLHIKLARILGAANIIATDIHGYRLDMAKQFGADNVAIADVEIMDFVQEVNHRRLADKVIVSTGALTAAKMGLKSVDSGGTVLFFTVPRPEEQLELDINAFWR